MRHQDSKRIRELEAEVGQMHNRQKDLDRRRQAERKRMARLEEIKGQQISELQRRLAQEGKKVKDLEAENVRQRETFRRETQRLTISNGGTSRRAHGSLSGSDSRHQAADGAPSLGGGSSSSSTSKLHQFEKQIDDHIRRHEASQSLKEDLQKRDALLGKREQYLSYRRKIAAKDTLEQQEAGDRMQILESKLRQLDQELKQAGPDAAQMPEWHGAHAEMEALSAEKAELQKSAVKKKTEGVGILHDIDERLEGLQDEVDFREARISKAQQLLHNASSGPLTGLDAELATIPPEDAKDLLCRYCEKIIRLRQRENKNGKRVHALEDQLEEKARQVSELQQVLRRHDANATKMITKVTKEYEARIQRLQQQLSSEKPHGPGQLTHAQRPQSASTSKFDESAAGLAAIEAAELQQLRRDVQYFKATNRELKRRLRTVMEEGGGPPVVMGDSQSSNAQVEVLASQVDRLEREKEALCEENGRVMTQIKNLKQYSSRFHNISSGFAQGASEIASPESPSSPTGAQSLRGSI
eukprot:gnl/TRDRNA2_/TRDRNA2_168721_c2_seq1.p1 gnl/TRDRNA2_/TRDRNA2_168721_c2~~gnl/TRDRNA2_/TRDRNA2_168721_c2_seq1.p1  ORF type:complete len:527 (+),score=155.38 gnl/TRDRNA2_/TRDRNA2_168721_c2_seq1:3-1583(+)